MSKRKKSPLKKTIFIICVFISSILFIDGLAMLYYTNANDKNRYNKDVKVPEKDSNTPMEGKDNNINENSESLKQENPINVLMLGLDADGTRADIIMLVNHKPGENRVNVLSITRDTKVMVEDKDFKINALVGLGGEKLIISKIEELTKLPIDYYVTMSFLGFRKIIDELGGVEIDVPFDMHYDDPAQNLHIHLKKGSQVLDGSKAEQFVRYRMGNRHGEGYKNGDLGRIAAQQMFIKEFIKQKLNLKYISKIDEVFSILKEYTKTNIKLADIMYYIKNFNIKIGEIKTWTIPGEPTFINDIAYYIYDSKLTMEMINANFYK